VSSPPWPALNAALNFSSAVCLLNGYLGIRRGRKETHKRWMLGAFSCSVIFLASYLAYHFRVGSVRFSGPGYLRTPYLALLLSHTVLAILAAPLAVATLSRALRGRFDLHRRIARVTFPIWIYVSLTGVIVYFMLYQM
jgi:uncharacterized membrane protein YozB (DUF420 family)